MPGKTPPSFRTAGFCIHDQSKRCDVLLHCLP
jgi:hypothetical protein